MKIILLKSVTKVGNRGDIVEVNDGYARNFLLARSLASPVTKGAVESIKKAEDKAKEGKRQAVNLLLEGVAGAGEIVIKEKMNEKGHLFASVDKKRIVAEVKKQVGVNLPEEYIELEHPLKEAGDYVVKVKIGGSARDLKIKVTG